MFKVRRETTRSLVDDYANNTWLEIKQTAASGMPGFLDIDTMNWGSTAEGVPKKIQEAFLRLNPFESKMLIELLIESHNEAVEARNKWYNEDVGRSWDEYESLKL